ncbi:hypothetical protein [Shimia ponticola]|uniref:hypothetical protein n=1 Tax=Shimia ponticola TaxID=2582893 RepID=UPI0011BF23E0|nr:hypothetical protein [Shimia ponticola]
MTLTVTSVTPEGRSLIISGTLPHVGIALRGPHISTNGNQISVGYYTDDSGSSGGMTAMMLKQVRETVSLDAMPAGTCSYTITCNDAAVAGGSFILA